MRKIALYALAFLFFTIYVLSLYVPFMEWWSEIKTNKLHIADSRTNHGDLYNYCFLPGYHDTPCEPLREYSTRKKGNNLFILHDSYLLSKIKKENFENIDSLILSDFRGEGVFVKPDTAKRNILIIECSERMAEWRLTDLGNMYAKMNLQAPPIAAATSQDEQKSIQDYFFNPNAGLNLEYNLFDYELFSVFKEIKALINYKLFGRIRKDVSLSSDKNYLLLTETIDTLQPTSSFKKLNSSEIEKIVSAVNMAVDYYMQGGFDEVYISIIPNPVSIVDEKRGTYNHKIEMICNHPKLNAKCIDVYPRFKKSGQQLYLRDDSHWNTNGIRMWVEEVNKKILSYP
jgi:hypothetical protein